nr:DUF3140 domain-containing protein [Streptomyces coryli]
MELDALWEEFHSTVNMTSQELGAWLRTSVAGEEAEELPERSGPETGRRVLGILQKRRVDLTEDDISTMYEVVEEVAAERSMSGAEVAEDSPRRHHLMSLGHDPLRPE